MTLLKSLDSLRVRYVTCPLRTHYVSVPCPLRYVSVTLNVTCPLREERSHESCPRSLEEVNNPARTRGESGSKSRLVRGSPWRDLEHSSLQRGSLSLGFLGFLVFKGPLPWSGPGFHFCLYLLLCQLHLRVLSHWAAVVWE